MNDTKKNIIWNLFSNALPLCSGIIFFPLIIKEYGLERFGLIGLIWAVLGYFGLFDLGLSRALTQLVAESKGKGTDPNDISKLIYTGFILTILLGILGGLFLWLFTPFIVNRILGVSLNLHSEVINSFLWLCISIPFVIHSTAIRGVLEGNEFFKITSIIRMLLGVGTFVMPYCASFYGKSLVYVMISMFILRFIIWVLYIYFIKITKILTKGSFGFYSYWMTPLVSFGGWISLSNIIGPFMTYMDRFAITFLMGATAVSYYIISYEMITKLAFVPMAICGVLFPIFAREWKNYPEKNAHRLMLGLQYTLLIITPPSLIIVYFIPEILNYWTNQEISDNGSMAAIWLSMGVMVNCLAQLYYTMVQGTGRSDWTAKLHFLELLPYILFLFIAIENWGVTGAAIAWFIRALVDLLGLIYLSNKINYIFYNKTKSTLIMSFIFLIFLSFSLFVNSFSIRIFLFSLFIFYYFIFLIKILKSNGAYFSLKKYLLFCIR